MLGSARNRRSLKWIRVGPVRRGATCAARSAPQFGHSRLVESILAQCGIRHRRVGNRRARIGVERPACAAFRRSSAERDPPLSTGVPVWVPVSVPCRIIVSRGLLGRARLVNALHGCSRGRQHARCGLPQIWNRLEVSTRGPRLRYTRSTHFPAMICPGSCAR